MSTPAQQEANHANALHSTGPRTDEGKAISSRNHTKLGLFARTDFVRPEEADFYDAFREALLEDLAPGSPFEQSLAVEIVSAHWRLRRCAEADAAGDGSVENPAAERARTRAANLLLRFTRELRSAQTNRLARAELIHCDDPAAADRGLADEHKLLAAWTADDRHRTAHFKQMMTPSAPQLASNCTPHFSPETNGPQVGRNTPCPCGSGVKYKRCCLGKPQAKAA